MHDWHEFFVATAGVGTALVGLLIIGISIKLVGAQLNAVLIVFPKVSELIELEKGAKFSK